MEEPTCDVAATSPTRVPQVTLRPEGVHETLDAEPDDAAQGVALFTAASPVEDEPARPEDGLMDDGRDEASAPRGVCAVATFHASMPAVTVYAESPMLSRERLRSTSVHSAKHGQHQVRSIIRFARTRSAPIRVNPRLWKRHVMTPLLGHSEAPHGTIANPATLSKSEVIASH